MATYEGMERTLTEVLGLRRRPVAVAYRDGAPAGVPAFEGTMPSGCSFWRLAGEGKAFYTVPRDHYNCPIGAHTHHIPLPPERAKELDDTLGLMVSVGYLRMEEVPGIPTLPATPQVIVYAPLGATPVDPDVVVLAGTPGRFALLYEAAVSAGAMAPTPILGRPTCMSLPAALAQGVTTSLACIGNRVYTDLAEDELYVTLPGRDLAKIVGELGTIARANAQLEAYHKDRRRSLATA